MQVRTSRAGVSSYRFSRAKSTWGYRYLIYEWTPRVFRVSTDPVLQIFLSAAKLSNSSVHAKETIKVMSRICMQKSFPRLNPTGANVRT